LLPSNQAGVDGVISGATPVWKRGFRSLVKISGEGADVFNMVLCAGGIVR